MEASKKSKSARLAGVQIFVTADIAADYLITPSQRRPNVIVYTMASIRRFSSSNLEAAEMLKKDIEMRISSFPSTDVGVVIPQTYYLQIQGFIDFKKWWIQYVVPSVSLLLDRFAMCEDVDYFVETSERHYLFSSLAELSEHFVPFDSSVSLLFNDLERRTTEVVNVTRAEVKLTRSILAAYLHEQWIGFIFRSLYATSTLLEADSDDRYLGLTGDFFTTSGNLDTKDVRPIRSSEH